LSHQMIASMKLSTPIKALAFDDLNGRLVAGGGGKLMFFDAKLHSKGSEKLKGLGGKGSLSLAFGPGGSLVVGKGGKTFLESKSASLRAAAAAGKFSLVKHHLDRGGVHGLAVDDLGNLLVARKHK